MKNELDSKDIQILSLLLNNARLSNKEIAAKIEIAQSSAHDRIKKLT
jgi:DNA-binding Lrp family transcriptional regulator